MQIFLTENYHRKLVLRQKTMYCLVSCESDFIISPVRSHCNTEKKKKDGWPENQKHRGSECRQGSQTEKTRQQVFPFAFWTPSLKFGGRKGFKRILQSFTNGSALLLSVSPTPQSKMDRKTHSVHTHTHQILFHINSMLQLTCCSTPT